MKVIPTKRAITYIQQAVETMGMNDFINKFEAFTKIAVQDYIGINLFLWTDPNEKEMSLINLMGYEECEN